MKALITGSLGFVGRYLRAELEAHGWQVLGLDVAEAPSTIRVDLLDADHVRRIIERERPDAVFHLVAQADVGKSWKQPGLTMEVNTVCAINLMEAIRGAGLRETRVVIVGSSDQYGNVGEKGAWIDESTPLKPSSPYAISKMAQEQMAKLYADRFGLNIMMTRSFNHSGAGQRTGFIIPDFASGIARIERGQAQTLSVGNLEARRDFTHVRDVVRAYRLIMEKGKRGEVYNVGSGRASSAGEILEGLRAMAQKPIEVVRDPERMRPSDIPVICCDHGKLTRDTGWEPELSLEDILRDCLEYYRNIV